MILRRSVDNKRNRTNVALTDASVASIVLGCVSSWPEWMWRWTIVAADSVAILTSSKRNKYEFEHLWFKRWNWWQRNEREKAIKIRMEYN